MARVCKNMGLVLVLVGLFWAQYSSAQAPAQPNCTPTIMSLSPCLGFITGNSSSTAPSSACCTQLASVVQTQAQCLCTVLKGAPQLPFVVNQTQALTLPGACNIQTPPLSQCNAVGPTTPATGAPQGAPAPASSTTPSTAAATPSPTLPTPTTPSTTNPSTPSTPSVPTTTPSGSKTVPKAGQSSSAMTSTKFAPSILFVLFVVASVVSI